MFSFQTYPNSSDIPPYEAPATTPRLRRPVRKIVTFSPRRGKRNTMKKTAKNKKNNRFSAEKPISNFPLLQGGLKRSCDNACLRVCCLVEL